MFINLVQNITCEKVKTGVNVCSEMFNSIINASTKYSSFNLADLQQNYLKVLRLIELCVFKLKTFFFSLF